jgi:hypothetical protein
MKLLVFLVSFSMSRDLGERNKISEWLASFNKDKISGEQMWPRGGTRRGREAGVPAFGSSSRQKRTRHQISVFLYPNPPNGRKGIYIGVNRETKELQHLFVPGYPAGLNLCRRLLGRRKGREMMGRKACRTPRDGEGGAGSTWTEGDRWLATLG